MSFDPEKVQRYEQEYQEYVMRPTRDGEMGWVQAADYDQLLALYRAQTEELHGYKQAASYGHDCEQMLWQELGAPLCPTHNKLCHAHCTAWLVEEFKRLREIEARHTQLPEDSN